MDKTTAFPMYLAGAGEGNRTLVFSLEGCCSTIELHPRPMRANAHRVDRQVSDPPLLLLSFDPFLFRLVDQPPSPASRAKAGGGGRTRTYEGCASGFTVRPL